MISLYFLVFVFGLIVGSFLNAVIYRLRIDESFLKGRSFCPHCKHSLNWKDLIPLLSFLLLKGKCRYCNKKISWQYPAIELATGILFVLTVYYTLPIIDCPNLLLTVFYLVTTCFLIIIFVYDLKHFIIPDKVTFSAIGIALIYNFYQLLTTHYSLSTILNGIYAALGAAGFFFAIILISKGRWMGFGDVKFALFMGLLLGSPNILVALFFAFLIGAIIGISLILAKRKTLKSEVPFGPFLVIGTFIALFWGQIIIDWYINLILF